MFHQLEDQDDVLNGSISLHLFQKSSRKILGLCYFKKRYGPHCDTIMKIFKRKIDCLCFFRVLMFLCCLAFHEILFKNVRVNNYIHFCIFGLYKTCTRPKTLFALSVANPRTKNFWPSLAYASQADHVQTCFCKKEQF